VEKQELTFVRMRDGLTARMSGKSHSVMEQERQQHVLQGQSALDLTN